MGKRTRKTQTDPTVPFRKGAVWLYPIAFVFHALLLSAVYRPLGEASSLAVLVAVGLGLGIRWMRSATMVLGLLTFLLGFMLLYLLGILVPVAFCVVVERREWIAWSALISTTLICSVLFWRIRESFRLEWSGALEESPGVVLDKRDNTLVRYPVEAPGSSFSIVVVASGVALILLFVVLRVIGSRSGMLIVALLILPTVAAILASDVVGRAIAYYWVARRWEISHGVKLKVPPLR